LLPSGSLRWDWVPSRSTYFPHFYDLEGGFQQAHIKQVISIAYDEDKKQHVIPNLD